MAGPPPSAGSGVVAVHRGEAAPARRLGPPSNFGPSLHSLLQSAALGLLIPDPGKGRSRGLPDAS